MLCTIPIDVLRFENTANIWSVAEMRFRKLVLLYKHKHESLGAAAALDWPPLVSSDCSMFGALAETREVVRLEVTGHCRVVRRLALICWTLPRFAFCWPRTRFA